MRIPHGQTQGHVDYTSVPMESGGTEDYSSHSAINSLSCMKMLRVKATLRTEEEEDTISVF